MFCVTSSMESITHDNKLSGEHNNACNNNNTWIKVYDGGPHR